MKTQKDKVVVYEDVRDAHIYDPEKDMKQKRIGSIISRIYEGERVQRHSFIPADNNPDGKKEFSLGPTTTSFQFIDHTEAMDPLLDKGFKIRRQVLGRGGLTMYAIMEPAEPIVLKDPIKWDSTLWDPKSKKEITISLMLHTSIRPGKGLSYDQGLFREVCSNGLVSEILNLGHLRFTHANWKPEVLEDFVKDSSNPAQKGLLGPYIGNKNGVSRFVRLLTRYIEGEDEINNEVPFYIEQSLNPILRMPKWFRWNFIEQLELFTEHGTDRFHGLDLLNALTTPIFNSEEEHALLRPLARIESLTRGSAMFIGTLSL